jgi:hypothetical protein
VSYTVQAIIVSDPDPIFQFSYQQNKCFKSKCPLHLIYARKVVMLVFLIVIITVKVNNMSIASNSDLDADL